ncbi:hypothetical protein BCR34DRAFT_160470 [Clohesyomyces aquaticus]|uniref:Uncharacterized protein n=1 Tax=Clohesyomyces aquaticus TaxID=1231657 RepID=A0A1Y1YJ21_9PLEO|nr:hypothetical protein BCR34DRAFT_160470 [Clohesyomyces aquaticus]
MASWLSKFLFPAFLSNDEGGELVDEPPRANAAEQEAETAHLVARRDDAVRLAEEVVQHYMGTLTDHTDCVVQTYFLRGQFVAERVAFRHECAALRNEVAGLRKKVDKRDTRLDAELVALRDEVAVLKSAGKSSLSSPPEPTGLPMSSTTLLYPSPSPQSRRRTRNLIAPGAVADHRRPMKGRSNAASKRVRFSDSDVDDGPATKRPCSAM